MSLRSPRGISVRAPLVRTRRSPRRCCSGRRTVPGSALAACTAWGGGAGREAARWSSGEAGREPGHRASGVRRGVAAGGGQGELSPGRLEGRHGSLPGLSQACPAAPTSPAPASALLRAPSPAGGRDLRWDEHNAAAAWKGSGTAPFARVKSLAPTLLRDRSKHVCRVSFAFSEGQKPPQRRQLRPLRSFRVWL